MKASLTCLIALIIITSRSAQTQPGNAIAIFLKQGNSAELTRLFSTNIELILPGDDDTYAKDRAGIILNKFFKEHKPKSVTTLHKVNSSASFMFEVFLVSTDKGPFRVACTLKNIGGSFKIIEMRIEVVKGS